VPLGVLGFVGLIVAFLCAAFSVNGVVDLATKRDLFSIIELGLGVALAVPSWLLNIHLKRRWEARHPPP
jgi:hypothetical protein